MTMQYMTMQASGFSCRAALRAALHALCRFYFPERALLRQAIKLKNLPGAAAVFNSGVLRNLAVACSHPDVVTGALREEH